MLRRFFCRHGRQAYESPVPGQVVRAYLVASKEEFLASAIDLARYEEGPTDVAAVYSFVNLKEVSQHRKTLQVHKDFSLLRGQKEIENESRVVREVGLGNLMLERSLRVVYPDRNQVVSLAWPAGANYGCCVDHGIREGHPPPVDSV
jgi:hypothetical protein